MKKHPTRADGEPDNGVEMARFPHLKIDADLPKNSKAAAKRQKGKKEKKSTRQRTAKPPPDTTLLFCTTPTILLSLSSTASFDT